MKFTALSDPVQYAKPSYETRCDGIISLLIEVSRCHIRGEFQESIAHR